MPIDMKSMIAGTFLDLAKQKEIDKITVKALIEACHISRQTFYYHFQDMMDVIAWSMEQAARAMLERGLKAGTPEEAFSIILSSAAENHQLIRKLMNSQKRDQVEKLFVQMIKKYIQELILNKAPELSLNYSDMELLLDFWAFGITGILFQHCIEERTDAQKLARQICRLLSERPKS